MSTITSEHLQQAEKRWLDLRDAGDAGAAEAYEHFQQLARQQTTELRQQAENTLISRLLK